MEGETSARAVWHVTVTVEAGDDLRCRIHSTRDVSTAEDVEEVAIGADEACRSLRRFLSGLQPG